MEPTKRQTARVRPWIRGLSIVALPILSVILAAAAWDYVETRRLMQEIDAIRAKGEPTTIGPYYGGRGSNRSDNAEYRYSAAALLSFANDTVGDPTVEGRSAMEVTALVTPVRQWLSGAGPRPGPLEVESATKTLLTNWQEVFSLVDRGASQPYRGVPPGHEYNYRVAGIMNLFRLVSTRTIGFSHAGQGDAAVDSAITALRLRRSIRPGQRWLAVTAAEIPAILSLSKPSEAALARLQDTLSGEEDPEGTLQDLIDMRARLLNDTWLSIYRVTPGRTLPPPYPTEVFSRPMITHDLLKSLRLWSELVEIGRKPWPERLRVGMDRIAPYANETPSRRGLTRTALAASLFYQSLRPDVLIDDRASRVAVAIERFRHTSSDALPQTLSDLVPRYLAAVPEDPFTGQPLRYVARPDAYMVYSVGPDGDDDGGTLLRQTPPSPTGQFDQKADVGIRVMIRR